MNYVEAPNKYEGEDETSLFLAGGITNCRDWQKEIAENLKDLSIAVFNPRRKDFSTMSEKDEEEQIRWEFDHLHKADAISFWFSEETLNPITLLELGFWLHSDKKLFVGIHPSYKKELDVIVQTKFARPDIEIVYSLEDLSAQIKDWESK